MAPDKFSSHLMIEVADFRHFCILVEEERKRREKLSFTVPVSMKKEGDLNPKLKLSINSTYLEN